MIQVALIVDNGRISEWQRLALEGASETIEIRLVLSCRNTITKKLWLKHAAYYLLNIIALKNSLTKRSVLRVEGAKYVNFDSVYEGMWQRIPEEVSSELTDVDLVIKFGMSLLRVDNSLSRKDILSFHHGDPERYRGRPAGFYELDKNEDRIGIVVQKLSNRLDAGDVLVRAYSKIYHHSYRKTACSFYHNSRHLLNKALINYSQGETVELGGLGENYRLPSNYAVARFACKLLYRKFARVWYGAFYEKKWNIVKLIRPAILKGDVVLTSESGETPVVAMGYNFYADPFFNVDASRIRVEAMSARSGLGEIIELDEESLKLSAVILKGGHYSCPYSFWGAGYEYVLPEVASHSKPYLERIRTGRASER